MRRLRGTHGKLACSCASERSAVSGGVGIQRAVTAGDFNRDGKLDAKKAMDAEVLIAAGVVRRAKDGLRLLGKGELKSKIDITVYSASASAREAVEKAGGKITTTKKEAPAEEA